MCYCVNYFKITNSNKLRNVTIIVSEPVPLSFGGSPGGGRPAASTEQLPLAVSLSKCSQSVEHLLSSTNSSRNASTSATMSNKATGKIQIQIQHTNQSQPNLATTKHDDKPNVRCLTTISSSSCSSAATNTTKITTTSTTTNNSTTSATLSETNKPETSSSVCDLILCHPPQTKLTTTFTTTIATTTTTITTTINLCTPTAARQLPIIASTIPSVSNSTIVISSTVSPSFIVATATTSPPPQVTERCSNKRAIIDRADSVQQTLTIDCGGGGGGGSIMNANFSKSETNLSGGGGGHKVNQHSNGTKSSAAAGGVGGSGGGGKKLAVFSVVSLNDLHENEDVAFGGGDHGKPMNDLSKNQTLNTISNDDIHSPQQPRIMKREF